jgi:hypothetical protein
VDSDGRGPWNVHNARFFGNGNGPRADVAVGGFAVTNGFLTVVFWAFALAAIALFGCLVIDITNREWSSALVTLSFLGMASYFAWDVSVTYHRYRRSGMGTL